MKHRKLGAVTGIVSLVATLIVGLAGSNPAHAETNSADMSIVVASSFDKEKLKAGQDTTGYIALRLLNVPSENTSITPIVEMEYSGLSDFTLPVNEANWEADVNEGEKKIIFTLKEESAIPDLEPDGMSLPAIRWRADISDFGVKQVSTNVRANVNVSVDGAEPISLASENVLSERAVVTEKRGGDSSISVVDGHIDGYSLETPLTWVFNISAVHETDESTQAVTVLRMPSNGDRQMTNGGWGPESRFHGKLKMTDEVEINRGASKLKSFIQLIM